MLFGSFSQRSNCKISCPEANPAPTITPTNAPAILLTSLNDPMACSPCWMFDLVEWKVNEIRVQPSPLSRQRERGEGVFD